MRTVKTPKNAEALVEYVSSHGIPKEILTDNKTNFISKYIFENYKKFRILSKYSLLHSIIRQME